jgi:hypothetical protein
VEIVSTKEQMPSKISTSFPNQKTILEAFHHFIATLDAILNRLCYTAD